MAVKTIAQYHPNGGKISTVFAKSQKMRNGAAGFAPRSGSAVKCKQILTLDSNPFLPLAKFCLRACMWRLPPSSNV